MGYEKATLGDIVQDRLTDCKGVVVEICDDGAWVMIDSHCVQAHDERMWFLPYGRLIRL